MDSSTGRASPGSQTPMATLATIQAATLEDYIRAWKTGNAEAMMKSLSGVCEQKLLPFTLGSPTHCRAEVEVILPKLLSCLRNYKLDIHHIVHDAARNKAAVYASSTADTPFEDLKWTNEYAVFISFTEGGDKIRKLEEMVDTVFLREWYSRFLAYQAQEQK